MFYSPESNARGVIFLILKDSRQTVKNANSTTPIPAAVMKPIGIVNVHFTIPIPFKNNAVRGLIMKLHPISPAAVERTVAGINDNAVCKISCFVVKPSAFITP